MTNNLIAGTAVLGDVLLMHKYYAKYNRYTPGEENNSSTSAAHLSVHSHLRAMTNNYDIYLKTCTKMYRFTRLLKECSTLKQTEPSVPRRLPQNWTKIEVSNDNAGGL